MDPDTHCIPITARIPVRILFAFLAMIVLGVESLPAVEDEKMDSGSEKTRHIVLIGASVGQAWDIAKLPERIGDYRYEFEYVGNYSPNKSDLLKEVLSRKENRPDAVILKECAAFFPGSSEKMEEYVAEWVRWCREANVIPMVATVVPVVKSYPLRIFIYNLFHGKWGYPKGVFESVIAFNDWIKEYAAKEGLVIVDLEVAVRTSESDRHLNGRYAFRDGLHLNAKAYKELDKIVIPAVSEVKFP